MKIYDTFIFFNELDLLEIRLNILNEAVDKFVIVEATKTFQNSNKKLYFGENKNRYGKFLNKIIHIVVDDMPISPNPWDLEAHHRNAILRGLGNCSKYDQIIISDVDEIPNPEQILHYAKDYRIRLFVQKLFYYYLNNKFVGMDDLPWSMMVSFNELGLPQEMRNIVVKVHREQLNGIASSFNGILIPHGGWHFSYLGGVSAIIEKIKAFSHFEYNTADFTDKKKVEEVILGKRDLFNRNYTVERVEIDDSFPLYIRKKKNIYQHLIDNNIDE